MHGSLGIRRSAESRAGRMPRRLSGCPRNSGIQEAVSPETRELDLAQYEGSALMVGGHYGGGWIYREINNYDYLSGFA